MKLTQKINVSQSDRRREFDAFNRRIQRQRIGFGLLTPGFGLAPDGIDISYGSRLQNDRAELDNSSCKIPAGNRTGLLRDAVRKVLKLVAQPGRAVQARQQQRKAIYKLLSSSDHFLDDIGLDRADLELLLHTNESLEQLVRSRREENDVAVSYAANVGISEVSPDDRGYAEIGLDRAA
jgi:uncharacterized protein YjiS (DUF1127 family)